jgi:SAM-dependent methyltransferase
MAHHVCPWWLGYLSIIDDVLRAEELRTGFLKYTRKAYALLSALDRPRILDVGCGSGLPTIELARLSGGKVVGIDTDEPSLARLRQRIEEAAIEDHVEAVNSSIFDTGFAEDGFDVLWEEGVLHLLDAAMSLTACHRLLRPGRLSRHAGNRRLVRGHQGTASISLPGAIRPCRDSGRRVRQRTGWPSATSSLRSRPPIYPVAPVKRIQGFIAF